MRYKCLILDHDDTSVSSTAEIHYPAHVETIKQMRPQLEPVSLEDWFRKNFEPGVMEYFTGELGFNEEEIKVEYDIWRKFNENANPHFFPGITSLIKGFQDAGGIIAVVSHSEVDNISRHYRVNGEGVHPDIIFGWDYDESKRKPSVWPVEQIKYKYGIEPSDMIMVDDLKPGLEMAKNAGIKIIGAGWGQKVPEIEKYMREHCDYYFAEVSQLAEFILN
ncbi:MAG: HAD hydrolase-like protein [Spirochaetales bacterium]|uniref:phosphoglycolate phosphatase n=1 Tax=Candidatus Thalassospirochaeta sargassi TaxID=3119039 RepID=A0AAJ1IK60_9SPIO|nr:HAD hydrolase-like protein [Spirochaetales bacterium]